MAQSPQFEIGSLVQRSFQIVLKNALVLVVGTLVIGVIQLAASSILQKAVGLGWAANLVLSGPLTYGLYGVALRASRGESPQFPALFDGFKNFLPAFLGGLVMSLAGIGWILCIVPGFIAYTFLCLMYFFMYDRKMDIMQSLQSSINTVKGAFGAWAILFLVAVVLNIAGCIALGVGLLISIPVSIVMLALAYDQAASGAGAI